jgi:hypothetical protein
MVHSWWRERNLKACAWVLLSCGLLLLPWSVRNELTFCRTIPIRSNMWAEVYFGNVDFSLHPLLGSMKYQRLGEIAYVDSLKQEVQEYVRTHPTRFATDTLNRAISFWIVPWQWAAFTIPLALGTAWGLWLSIRNVGSRVFPILLTLLSYPLIYSVSYVFSRYRHPIEPFMYLLTAYAVCQAARLYGKSRLQSEAIPPDVQLI